MNKRLVENFLFPFGLFLLAFVLRIIWGAYTHAPTLDTAVVGLMAMDIQEGARPLFFTGQGYMGALEAYLMAGVFELFGADRFTMTLVPGFFGSLWPVLMYFFLKLDVPAKPALAGALLVAFPAGHILWYTTVPYGGYPEMYVFGMVMLLHAALRLKQQKVFPWRDALLFSVFAFLGAWTNLQVAPFLGTAGLIWLYLLLPDWKRPSRWLPFALVPLALALAVIPQILISAENPSSPPLFSAASAKQVAYSLKALWKEDLLALMTFQGLQDWPRWIWAPAYILLPLLGILTAIRPPRNVRCVNLALCGIFVAIFSILYFPHSMSGYVPRYLIAPFVMVLSICFSLALATTDKLRLWLAGAIFTGWAVLQLSSFPDTVRIRHAKTVKKLDAIEQAIDVSRAAGLTHLRYIGSGMEGHRVAAYTFESGKDPIFTSSYDERRRDADLAWHESQDAGYIFANTYLSFVKGSLQAMGIHNAEFLPAGYFVVMPMPQISVEKFAAMKAVPVPFTWQENQTSLIVNFPDPVKLTGLRLSAPANASLPYQYQIKDGRGNLLSESSKRLGSSYISGDRVYFKGYEDQMDVFWPATEVTSLEFSFTPGSLNKQPIRLQDLFVFAEAPPAPPLDLDALTDWLHAHPQAQITCSDGTASFLRRQGLDTDRLPLPWNPRDPQAQALEFELAPGTLLLLENRYLHDPDALSFGPIQGILLEESAHWKRFRHE
ncbi:hypothetical protein P0Y35_16970 [Kiritimatiellaeota bacterium B1221]|nr:hypothetical protein [Kiritimatiellaeota bacterium B1221]